MHNSSERKWEKFAQETAVCLCFISFSSNENMLPVITDWVLFNKEGYNKLRYMLLQPMIYELDLKML